jgi:hypothetical protein
MPSFKRQIERKVSAQAAIRQIKNLVIANISFVDGLFAFLLAVFGRSLGWNLVIGIVRQCSMGSGPDFFVGKPVSPVSLLRIILNKETYR